MIWRWRFGLGREGGLSISLRALFRSPWAISGLRMAGLRNWARYSSASATRAGCSRRGGVEMPAEEALHPLTAGIVDAARRPGEPFARRPAAGEDKERQERLALVHALADRAGDPLRLARAADGQLDALARLGVVHQGVEIL